MGKVTNIANNPNAIEAQESVGQTELKESSYLPIQCNYPRNIDIKKQYEVMGITVIEK